MNLNSTAPLQVMTLMAFAFGLFCAAPVFAQDAQCRASMTSHFEDTSPEMNAAVDRLKPEDRTRVLNRAHCDAKHFNLGKVFEETVRILDVSSMGDQKASLFISASQTLLVQEPKRSFTRDLVTPSLSSIPAAQPFLSAKYSPKALAWRGVLSELNAKTHALQGWSSLLSKNLLETPPALSSKPADELAFAMLTAAAYLDHARSQKPPVFTSLAASEPSVDAFKLLWSRAETTLRANKGRGLGKHTDDLLRATYAYLPAIQDLFRMSGRSAPAFLFQDLTIPEPVVDTATTPSVDQVTNTDEDPAKPSENSTPPLDNAAEPSEDPTKPAEDSAKPADNPATTKLVEDPTKPASDPAKPADDPQTTPPTQKTEVDAAQDSTATPTPSPTTPTAQTTQDAPATPTESSATKTEENTPKEDPEVQKNESTPTPTKPLQSPDPKKDEAKKDEAKKDEAKKDEGLSTLNITRLVIGGILLLIPWILVLLLYLRRRKNDPSWIRLSNRFIALATFVLFLEVCAIGIVAMSFDIAWFARMDGLYLIAPIYTFVVLLLMVRKFDSDDDIVTLQMLKRWTKWGLPALLVLIVANVIMSFWPFIGTYSLPITSVIVAIVLSIFMIRLWRTGNLPDEDVSGDRPPVQSTPPEPSNTKPPTAPKSKESAASKPAKKSIPVKDHLDPKAGDATSGSTGMEEMSDEDFAALLEGIDDGSEEDTPK